jgi:hypothetical protein
MKTYAKSIPGSVYVVDRRHQRPVLETVSAEEAGRLGEPSDVLGHVDANP